MKKILMVLVCCLVMCGCEGKSDKMELPSSKELLEQLKEKNSNLSEIEEFTSETDPNEQLGRPGYYISKADFSDTRVEQIGEYLCGGTIETFSSEKDCKNRANYLNEFNDPEMGAFGLNQYVYQYNCVLFRISYDLTPEQAEEYHAQMDEIMNQYEDVPERKTETEKEQPEEGKTENADLLEDNVEENENDDSVYRENMPDTEENIISKIDIKDEKASNGDIVVFLTNNNSFAIPDLDIQIVYYKDGNIVETDEDGHDVLVPKNTVVSKMAAPSEYDDYDISLVIDWNTGKNYRNWIYNLELQSNIGEDNVIIQFKNIGDVNIEELEYIVVFYKENEIVDTSYPEDVIEFEAGKEIIEKVSTYDIDFDEYEIYINQAHTFGFERISGDIVRESLPDGIGKKKESEKDNTQDEEEKSDDTKEENEDIEQEKDLENETKITTGQINAVKKAKEYLSFTSFSHKGLVGQLEYEGFTKEESTYGADNCEADWNEQASKKAKDYLEIMAFSKDGLIGQLEYDGFTHEQSVYGAEQNGY